MRYVDIFSTNNHWVKYSVVHGRVYQCLWDPSTTFLQEERKKELQRANQVLFYDTNHRISTSCQQYTFSRKVTKISSDKSNTGPDLSPPDSLHSIHYKFVHFMALIWFQINFNILRTVEGSDYRSTCIVKTKCWYKTVTLVHLFVSAKHICGFLLRHLAMIILWMAQQSWHR